MRLRRFALLVVSSLISIAATAAPGVLVAEPPTFKYYGYTANYVSPPSDDIMTAMQWILDNDPGYYNRCNSGAPGYTCDPAVFVSFGPWYTHSPGRIERLVNNDITYRYSSGSVVTQANQTFNIKKIWTCPAGYVLGNAGPNGVVSPFVEPLPTCTPTGAIAEKCAACAGDPTQMQGNPINIGSGQKVQSETDYLSAGPFPIVIGRTYNSGKSTAFGDLGDKWGFSYSRGMELIEGKKEGGEVYMRHYKVFRPDGRLSRFTWYVGGPIQSDGDSSETLAMTTDGPSKTCFLTTAEDSIEQYAECTNLVSITNRAGVTQTVTYIGGALASIDDGLGRVVNFTTDGGGRIVTMTDPAGGVFTYEYNSDNLLSKVTFPDTRYRQYLYGEIAFTASVLQPRLLTGIVDENGNRYATYKYDASGRAISTEHGIGLDKYSVSYGGGSATVIDPLGTSRYHSFTTVMGVVRNQSVSQSGQSQTASVSYDGNGNIASHTDFRGTITTYTYDTNRNLETSRTEASNSTVSCPTGGTYYTSTYGAACNGGSCWANAPFPGSVSGAALGYPSEHYACPAPKPIRTIATTWHNDFRLPLGTTETAPEGTRQTAMTYDADGNLLTHTVTKDGTTRTTTLTYNTLGQIATINGPRTDLADVTQLGYTASGNLASITDALGRVTQITSHDAHGKPLTIVDANGVTTTLTYAPRGWLKTRTTAGETTTYDYDYAGNLTQLTPPDGAWLQFGYDTIQRLTSITDSANNRIEYTLDNIGNRTAERIYNSNNVQVAGKSRVIDAYNRISQDINGLNQITKFDYDGNGNLTKLTDGRNIATHYAYDAYNRLGKITDPAGNATRLKFDGFHQLATVADPRNLGTSYGYTGQGDVASLASPDTGSTANQYDAAGNQTQITDARGQTGTISYDALNRPTQIVWSDQTITLSYDQGTHGIDRLTGLTDNSGTSAITYDAHGRVLSQTHTPAILTQPALAIALTYHPGGQVNTLTYPSGRQISISQSHGKPSGITLTTSSGTQNILNTIAYQPFGPIKGWTWANAATVSRTFDAAGRLTAFPVGTGTSRTLTIDAAERITAITDTGSNPQTATYTYDNLDRLTGQTVTGNVSLSQTYGYDATGNRSTQTKGGVTTAFTTASTSNRLIQVGTTARTFNAAGNTTNDGTVTYGYDARGRLTSATIGSNVYGYVINAFGQRIGKTLNGTTLTRYVYDPSGKLLGEYDASGNAIQETVWLGDMPVAILKTNPGNAAITDIYYVYADQLNTPRQITNTANQAVWTCDNTDPFGANLPNENPSGLGGFTFNGRFPGQQYDAETGNHYNFHRTYEPKTGRYVESDPIGLAGGVNTYGYVNANPLSLIDPLGLDANQPNNMSFCSAAMCSNTPDPRAISKTFEQIGMTSRALGDYIFGLGIEGPLSNIAGFGVGRLVGFGAARLAPICTKNLASGMKITDAMSDKQFTRLVKDIKLNGLKNPVIDYVEVAGQNYVVIGNNRLLASRQLGITDQLVFREAGIPVPNTSFYTIQEIIEASTMARRPIYRGQ